MGAGRDEEEGRRRRRRELFQACSVQKKKTRMIYEKINNIAIYEALSKDIYEGLAFLGGVGPEIETGVHVINPRVRAIVSEYETKEQNELGYEAHREYIDIQYLISGEEKICCVPLEYLKEKVA